MKPLNQWARYFGYNDFDTFIRAGGSILDAARDIAQRIRTLQAALKALPMDPRYLDEREPLLREPALFDPDTRTEDETVDPENAHVQGAECG
jgi:hypothetical protein